MRKTSGLFLLMWLATAALLFCPAVEAAAQTVQWEKDFTGYYGHDVKQTSDGGYIVCGYTYSYSTSYDVVLIKTDSGGNMQWGKVIGTSDYEYGRSVEQTPDGGYIVAGYVYVNALGDYGVLLLKTDSSGNTQWQKVLGNLGYTEQAYDLEQTSDGGYIICGQSGISGGQTDAMLMKTDAGGNMQWMKTFGGADYDHGRAVHQTPDGGYAFGGMYYRTWPSRNRYDAWLVKTDSGGNMQWQQLYDGPSYDYVNGMKLTPDGGYILGGYTHAGLPNLYQVMLIKTDSAGNSQWNKNYGGSGDEYGYSLDLAADGGYVVGGQYRSGAYFSGKGLILKTDAAGTTEWLETSYGGSGLNYIYSIQQTTDSHFVATGYKRPCPSGCAYTVWLLKLGDPNQPPVANAGADQSLAAGVSCTATALLDGSGSSDADSTGGTNDDIVSFNWYEGATLLGSAETMNYSFGPGSHTVSLLVTDQAGASDSDDAIINVADTAPPALSVPADVVAECTGPGGQSVNIGQAAASDNCCDATITNDAPSLFSLGSTVVTWTATDCYGNSSSATQTVTVQDTTPPDLSATAAPNVLWPPNHKMVDVTVTTTAYDICCGVTVNLVSVRMDEADVEDTFDPLYDLDPSTGFIGQDIQIIGGQVLLRAERSGTSDGRVYTLTYEATDCAGNTSTVEVVVTVPRNMS